MRRGQLISPFGVGAMSTLVNGTSVVTAGLDAWFKPPAGSDLYLEEFSASANDPRLLRRLGVEELRLPPDYRTRSQYSEGTGTNTNLSVPVLRFPGWSFCPWSACRRLKKWPLTLNEVPRCDSQLHEGWKSKPTMHQVPFVAICPAGHLMDFPFAEWVHKSPDPSCQGSLTLRSTGGGTLAGQLVTCACGASRNLGGVLEGALDRDGNESSVLTEALSPVSVFSCRGSKPWAQEVLGFCGQPLRGALRGAGNVYFPKVESSIFLPQGESPSPQDLIESLRRPQVYALLSIMVQLLVSPPAAIIRQRLSAEYLLGYPDDVIESAVAELFGSDQYVETGKASSSTEDDLEPESSWRAPEYEALRTIQDYADLKTTNPGLTGETAKYFALVHRVESLRETRALRGFTRLRDSALGLSNGKDLLRRSHENLEKPWLPAYVVRGEGIFFQFREDKLRSWESDPKVVQRIVKLNHRREELAEGRGAPTLLKISPRLVLLHTFAHVMINQLIFSCGYGSASLRERIYVSDQPSSDETAGVLIYTAAGDSEGTMGGLVRMANPADLSKLLSQAMLESEWCSSDPVCMELGKTGQGPDGCNLAACHSCGLLPETSCEMFNRWLDRGVLIGDHEDKTLGFFSELL
ncbi:DUF1998 domain-containing protein [Arthrobacter sp. Leaf69]|uniref:DUF1998 domain-containing protein n=1 Tax=Arthrobacter sp. Leaf69 TaxID=1736232 RepID=UPI0009EBD900|nr:DUF1998 domain-containing protein [Arthrobacter sp. Leaf69]